MGFEFVMYKTNAANGNVNIKFNFHTLYGSISINKASMLPLYSISAKAF